MEKPNIMSSYDSEELEEINKRIEPKEFVKAVSAMPPEMLCTECQGRKIMTYIRTQRAPWLIRVLFKKEYIEFTHTDRTCKRCRGKGVEPKPNVV